MSNYGKDGIKYTYIFMAIWYNYDFPYYSITVQALNWKYKLYYNNETKVSIFFS